MIMDRPRGPRGGTSKLSECLVGDETGVIIFSAKNDQGESTHLQAVAVALLRAPHTSTCAPLQWT